MPLILSEILNGIDLKYFIDLDDPESLSRAYDVGDEKLQGGECVARMIADTFARGYKLELEKIINMGEDADFISGPEKYLELHYSVKIINEIAFKYKVLTRNVVMDALSTWDGHLRPNIFSAIMNSQDAMNSLRGFDLEEHIPAWRKQNPDFTMTSYKYDFYRDEEQDWKNQERLMSLSFQDGHVKMKMVMPIKEVKTIPKSKEIE